MRRSSLKPGPRLLGAFRLFVWCTNSPSDTLLAADIKCMPYNDVRYSKAPLKSVTVQINTLPGKQWDNTTNGLFYAQIKDRYPTVHAAPQLQVGFTIGVGSLPAQAPFSSSRFSDASGRIEVAIAPHQLSISSVKEYETWEEFLPIVVGMFAVYRQTVTPKSVNRIGLRVINELRMPPESVGLPLDEYFTMYPSVPALPTTGGPRAKSEGWLTGTQLQFKDGQDSLKIQFYSGKNPADAANPLLVLDFDYFTNSPCKVEMPQVDSWITDAHDSVQDAFETILTEKTKSIFR